MGTLHLAELATLGNQLFTGQRPLTTIGAPYSSEDFIEGLAETLATLQARVAAMSEPQCRFRLPGQPEGADWNHDQHHFSTSELVTHLTYTLKRWQEAMIAEGLPLPTPIELWDEPAARTGQQGPGRGIGGRDDLTQPQLLQELAQSREPLLQGLRALSAAQWATPVPHPRFGTITAAQMLMIMGFHSAAHTFQLMEMQAHPDYPTP